MKKVILLIITGIFLIIPLAFAGYTLKAKKDVETTLQRFFQEEQGNRLSSYSMRGLLMEINRTFGENITRPEVQDADPIK